MQRVLVLGVPRSGTTWIGQALGCAEGATYVHEPDGAHDPFAYRAKLRLASPILQPGERADEYHRLWRGAFDGGRPARTLRDRAARRWYRGVTAVQRADAREGLGFPLRLRLATMLAVPRVAVPGAQAVVVKSVDAALSVEWIAAEFTPRVLIVRRDLRSVLSSWLALGMQGPRQRGYEILQAHAGAAWGVKLPPFTSTPIVRGAAVCAVWSIALGEAQQRHADWIELSHEAVCADPVSQLRSAAASLGLNWSGAIEEFLAANDRPGEGYATQRVRSDATGSWQQRLDAEQVDAIEDVLARFPEALLR